MEAYIEYNAIHVHLQYQLHHVHVGVCVNRSHVVTMHDFAYFVQFAPTYVRRRILSSNSLVARTMGIREIEGTCFTNEPN